jgi:Tfp pilus assembly protein PilV
MGKLNQRGFIPMLIAIFVILVSIIGFAFVHVMKANK